MAVVVRVVDEPITQCDEEPKLSMKRGDSFQLDMVLTDYNSNTAQAAQHELDVAYQILADAHNTVPPDLAAIAAAEQSIHDNQLLLHDALMVDITGWVITSQIRWKGRFINDVTVIVYDPTEGGLTLKVDSALTEAWQPRVYTLDIQFNDPSAATTVSSQTLLIDVEKDIYYV